MKNYLTFVPTLLVACGFAMSPPVAAQSRLADYTFGGSGQEICSGIIPASDGGFIVGGSTISGVSGEVTIAQRATGATPSMDYWMFKMDAQGNKLWEKRYGGSGDDRLIKVLPSPDGGYLLCGWTDSPTGFDVTAPARGDRNYWVVKTDVQGNMLWNKRYGSAASEMLYTAIATPDGGYLLSGNTGGPLVGPSGDRSMATRGPMDVWTIKIDALGNKQWDNLLSGDGGIYVYGAANIPGGGYALLALPFGPVSGDVTGPSNGNEDLWLVKLDATGNKVWDRLYGGSGYDSPHALLATADGGLLLAGSSGSPISGDVSQGGGGLWLLKLDAMSAKQWDHVYSGTAIDRIIDIKALPNGDYTLLGRTRASPQTPSTSDLELLNVAPSGSQRWAQSVGGASNELGNNMAVLANGDLLLAGTSDSNVGRDKTANSRGVADIWVVKMSTSTGALSTATQLLNAKISVYPNPINASRVSLALSGLREQAPVKVECLNALGQVMHSTRLVVVRGNIQQEMILPALPVGLYTLRVYAAEGVITQQLLKN
ncbi:T9SS type A sorting domain-containing protein [Hymenobacter sp. BT523]|uniref:T9SS type A sorting domain-containing protein n=1 Tax=Hymenobacter sp. BT523 TaxID=2795725 RepID=UPI0018EE2C07|nr:T9SS type A sorting domain-containing protein [Hymenobacter sp. BT523]MBJ6110675.1 T9SS type A sorting domain-containing protein [Hymenobacter sp. BT523]